MDQNSITHMLTDNWGLEHSIWLLIDNQSLTKSQSEAQLVKVDSWKAVDFEDKQYLQF